MKPGVEKVLSKATAGHKVVSPVSTNARLCTEMCIHAVVCVCRDATPYPCCPTASKTNRQHAHDAWLYERERGKGRRRRKRKSEQDEVGAKTTGLLFASVRERPTSSDQHLKDDRTRLDPPVFLKLVSTT